MKTTAFFTRILSWLTGSRLKVDNSVVRTLDLDRFLGSWYEVARFDHFFERGMSQTKANYVLREDGNIDVINTGIKDGKPKTARGKAKLTDTPALFRVSFFGPFYSDYRIMLLDADYRYMLIGSGSDTYLWILSRMPQIQDRDRATILAEANRRGYDTGKLIWVKQKI
jgi:lipocalin